MTIRAAAATAAPGTSTRATRATRSTRRRARRTARSRKRAADAGRRSRVRAGALAAVVTVTVGVALATAGAPALAASKGPSLGSLVRQTKALPRGVVPRAKKHRLVRLAGHARRAAGKRACVAVKDLARYRRALGGVKVRKSAKRRARNRLAALAPASLRLS